MSPEACSSCAHALPADARFCPGCGRPVAPEPRVEPRRFRSVAPLTTLAVRLRDWSGFAAGSAGAWSRAGRELFAARRELAALRAARERTEFELGAAAYRQDEAEVERLRARMHELDERARERAALTHEAVEEARRRIGDERLAIQPTEVVEIDRERVP